MAKRFTWGGRRAGAGRPPRSARSSEPHKTRPALEARHPIHVIAHVVSAIGSLRSPHARAAIDRAIATSLAREDFRIVQLGLVATRVELIVEATDRTALARGMQGFQVSAARYLNATSRRRGTVFPDRYRARILRTPRAVSAAVSALPRLTLRAAPLLTAARSSESRRTPSTGRVSRSTRDGQSPQRPAGRAR